MILTTKKTMRTCMVRLRERHSMKKLCPNKQLLRWGPIQHITTRIVASDSHSTPKSHKNLTCKLWESPYPSETSFKPLSMETLNLKTRDLHSQLRKIRSKSPQKSKKKNKKMTSNKALRAFR